MEKDLLPDHIVVVDVEGNGQTPPDLIEVAIQPFKWDLIAADTSRSWLIRPPKPILSRVARIHHISNKLVSDSPTWSEIADDIEQALDNSWIVAHNAKIEYDALSRHLPNWSPVGVLDTLLLSRKVWPSLPSYSLDALIAHAKLDLTYAPEHRHRAAYDVYATALLFIALLIELPNMSWDGLCRIACPPKLPAGLTVKQGRFL